MKYKLIAMDLDGTLTQHKSKLNKHNTQLLLDLKKDYDLVMVGAGGCLRIYNQMNQFPIDIIGNYGLQESTIENGQFKLIRNDVYTIDKDFFINTINELRSLTGYTNYAGETVEFHDSGLVTFPLIGTKAKLEDKLAFDPDGKKRSLIYDLVVSKFPGFNCFIGGSSSFDIAKDKYNKYHALVEYLNKKNLTTTDVIYIGDDFKKGGNDEAVMLSDIECIHVFDYTKIRDVLVEHQLI